MSAAALLDQLMEATIGHDDWSVLRRAVAARRRVHLAVMVEPYLSYILGGQKSIESRFSKNAIAPYYQIEADDLVLLKLTGGPVVGCFTAAAPEFVSLDQHELARLRRDYSTAICADDEFWRVRQDKRYATLIGVKDQQELQPAPVAKSDRRGWLVLHCPAEARRLGEQLELI
jgi:hypothetical protein